MAQAWGQRSIALRGLKEEMGDVENLVKSTQGSPAYRILRKRIELPLTLLVRAVPCGLWTIEPIVQTVASSECATVTCEEIMS